MTVEIKYNSVVTDGRNLFCQPVTSNIRTYNIIYKDANCQGDDYATSSLLDYPYFNKHYKIIRSQQSFLFLKKQRKNIFDFSWRTGKI